ncbi:MAG: hypothetical protein AB1630_00805 [bacterium]
MKKTIRGFIQGMTKEKDKDSCMAAVFLCLLINHYLKAHIFFIVALFFLIVGMVYPQILRPLTILWFGLSHILSFIVPNIILTIVFFLFVTPLGFLSNFFRGDILKIKQFKKNNNSIFRERNYVFCKEDLVHPF